MSGGVNLGAVQVRPWFPFWCEWPFEPESFDGLVDFQDVVIGTGRDADDVPSRSHVFVVADDDAGAALVDEPVLVAVVVVAVEASVALNPEAASRGDV